MSGADAVGANGTATDSHAPKPGPKVTPAAPVDSEAQLTASLKPVRYTPAVLDTAVNSSDSDLGFLSVVTSNPNFKNDTKVGGTQGAYALLSAGLETTSKAITGVKAAPQVLNGIKKAPSVIKSIPDALAKLKNLKAVGEVTTVVENAAPTEVANAITSAAGAGAPAEAGVEGAVAGIATKSSALGKIGALGFVGAGITVGVSAFQYHAADAAGDGYRKANAVGSGVGGVVGIGASIATGALIGQMAIPVPFLGAAIGAVSGLAIGYFSTKAGGKIAENMVGAKWQQEEDAKTKIERETDIAALKSIKDKYAVLDKVAPAQAEFNAALASHDVARITKAKFTLNEVSHGIATFQGMSAEDQTRMAALTKDLAKHYVNEKALQIPAGDVAAKKRQQQAIAELEQAGNDIAVVQARDKQIKQQLTPQLRQQILAENEQHQKLADGRIDHIQLAAAAQTQHGFEQKLAKATAPVLKYDNGGSQTLAQIAALDRSIEEGVAAGTLKKAELAKLNTQKTKELAQIATAEAELRRDKTQQARLLHDPHAKQYAEANIHGIEELGTRIEAIRASYTTTDEQSRKAIQMADAKLGGDGAQRADSNAPALKVGDGKLPADMRADNTDTMKAAVGQAKGATTELAKAGAKDSTPDQAPDPAKDKVAMDRTLAALTPELQRA
jgi:hypothetical protein